MLGVIFEGWRYDPLRLPTFDASPFCCAKRGGPHCPPLWMDVPSAEASAFAGMTWVARDRRTRMNQAGGCLASVICVTLGLNELRDTPSGLLWWIFALKNHRVSQYIPWASLCLWHAPFVLRTFPPRAGKPESLAYLATYLANWAYASALKPMMGLESGDMTMGRRIRRGSASMASMSSSRVTEFLRWRYGFALGLRHEKMFSMPMSSVSLFSSSRVRGFSKKSRSSTSTPSWSRDFCALRHVEQLRHV